MVLVYILLVSCFFGWAVLNQRRDITQPGGSSEPLLHPVEEDGIDSEPKESTLGVKVHITVLTRNYSSSAYVYIAYSTFIYPHVC